jgi:hypothetical protein
MSDDQARRRLARHILMRLGETGQPPERGALEINVGTDHHLEALRREYLVPMRESGLNSTFKLVQAPFGGGKTQFLHCLREVAWQEGGTQRGGTERGPRGRARARGGCGAARRRGTPPAAGHAGGDPRVAAP